MSTQYQVITYQYDELSEDAQERARDNAREWANDDSFIFESVVDQFIEEIETSGLVTIKRRQNHPCVWYTIYGGQGSGAAWEGEIHLATWMKAQRVAGKYRTLYNYCAATGHSVTVSSRGLTMQFDADTYYLDEKADAQYAEIEDDIEQWAISQAHDLHASLEAEYDYQTSDESIVEMLRANEYDYTANGDVFTRARFAA